MGKLWPSDGWGMGSDRGVFWKKFNSGFILKHDKKSSFGLFILRARIRLQE